MLEFFFALYAKRDRKPLGRGGDILCDARSELTELGTAGHMERYRHQNEVGLAH